MPLRKIYHLNPIPKKIPEKSHNNILGVESPLWTEFVTDRERMSFQIFPRLLAVAEIGWTELEMKKYSDFKSRVNSASLLIRSKGFGMTPEKEWDPKGLHRLKKFLTIFFDFSGRVKLPLKGSNSSS